MVIVAVVTTVSILTNRIGGNPDSADTLDENSDESIDTTTLVSTTVKTLTTAASTVLSSEDSDGYRNQMADTGPVAVVQS